MREVNYKCDKCHKDVKDLKDFTHITIYVGIGSNRVPSHYMEICEECANELGFIEPKNDKKYIDNYNYLIRNAFSIIKKILKWG